MLLIWALVTPLLLLGLLVAMDRVQDYLGVEPPAAPALAPAVLDDVADVGAGLATA